MTAQIYNIRDYQNPKDLARMYSEKSLVDQANAIFAIVQPFGVDFSAAEPYHAKPEDCA